MRFPSLVMLEPFVFRRDDEDSFPDDTKAPIRASATTSWGARFSIAFHIAQPPSISRLYAQLPEPGFLPPNVYEHLAILATHRHLALFRVSGCLKNGLCRPFSSTTPTRTQLPPRSKHSPLVPSPTLISDAARAAYLVVTLVPPLLPACWQTVPWASGAEAKVMSSWWQS